MANVRGCLVLANSGFDNSIRLDIICIRMNLPGAHAGRIFRSTGSGKPFFWKAKRDPLRETHHD